MAMTLTQLNALRDQLDVAYFAGVISHEVWTRALAEITAAIDSRFA